MDAETTLGEVKAQVRRFVEERDWQQYHSPRNLAESISIEAAELMEIFQWGAEITPERGQRLREELADVLIYCVSMANSAGLDISEIIGSKMASNAQKYPASKARGNAKKHNEL